MPTVTVDVLSLLENPSWDPARTRALTGRCRSAMVAGWAANLERRRGGKLVERVLARLHAEGFELSPTPRTEGWVPVAMQLRLAEVMVEEGIFAGLLGLLDGVREDTARAVPWAARVAMRGLGPRRFLARSADLVASAYGVVGCDVELGAQEVRLRFDGEVLFTHPTWQLLQVAGMATLFDLTSVDATVAHEPIEGGVQLSARWG